MPRRLRCNAGKSPISSAWSATGKPPATPCCANTNDGKDGPRSRQKSAVPTIMKRRPGKKSRPRKRPHSNHGDRETDCRQPRQCQAQHWPKNRGWPSNVQPQRVSARPVAGIAASDPAFRARMDAMMQALLGSCCGSNYAQLSLFCNLGLTASRTELICQLFG